jgi:catechol 2,3-dioxygenase-like lactoylglutathione lyase family enzyme
MKPGRVRFTAPSFGNGLASGAVNRTLHSMVIGLHHVQISMAPERIVETRRFYIDLIGMHEIPDPFGIEGFWLQAGDHEVHVRVEDGIEREKTRAHPAFLLNDRPLVRQKLQGAGYEIIDQPKMKGYERFHVIDPSGNRVELLQRED